MKASTKKTSGRKVKGNYPKGHPKVKKVMEEFKDGTLKSSSGARVTSRKQAIAIGLSEARKAGDRIPPKKRAGRS